MLAKIRKNTLLFVFLIVFLTVSVLGASERSKYPSDAAYANFRNVRTGTIGKNNLYRSVHPADSSARAPYANKLAEENGIQTVLNLSDSKNDLALLLKQKKIGPTYYYKTLADKGSVYTADLHGSHNSPSFCQKITDGLKFFTKNKGPYLIHCQIGRDRTGLVLLLLESLMGAPYSYMLDDYAQSYVNINGYSSELARETAINCLKDEFNCITGEDRNTDWTKLNLVEYAEKYLKQGGMTDQEIAALKKNLSVSYTTKTTSPDSSSKNSGSTSSSQKVNKETPAYRNLSIDGKTTLTKKVKVGKTVSFNYKLKKGNIKNYAVVCLNSNSSVVRVKACGNGKLKIYARKKGTAVLRLRSKSDPVKRVKLTIKVQKK